MDYNIRKLTGIQFFIPKAMDKDQQIHVYQTLNEIVLKKYGTPLDRKIYSLKYKHNRQEYIATVGEISDYNKSLVLGIIEISHSFFVFTHPGDTIQVGIHEAYEVTEFAQDEK